MRFAIRITITALGAILGAVAAVYLAIELYFYKYAQVVRLPREDLANDYGAAFDSVVIGVAVFLVCLPLAAFIAWRVLGRVKALRDG